jgi:hypothetical protein
MSGYRCEAEAFAGPAREGLLYGARQLLVRVRLHDGPGAVDDHGRPTNLPDAYTDLRPEQTRQLALALLQAAEDAEQQTLQANWWKQEAAR